MIVIDLDNLSPEKIKSISELALKRMINELDKMNIETLKKIIELCLEICDDIGWKTDELEQKLLSDIDFIRELTQKSLKRMQNDLDEFDSDKMKKILILSGQVVKLNQDAKFISSSIESPNDQQDRDG